MSVNVKLNGINIPYRKFYKIRFNEEFPDIRNSFEFPYGLFFTFDYNVQNANYTLRGAIANDDILSSTYFKGLNYYDIQDKLLLKFSCSSKENELTYKSEFNPLVKPYLKIDMMTLVHTLDIRENGTGYIFKFRVPINEMTIQIGQQTNFYYEIEQYYNDKLIIKYKETNFTPNPQKSGLPEWCFGLDICDYQYSENDPNYLLILPSAYRVIDSNSFLYNFGYPYRYKSTQNIDKNVIMLQARRYTDTNVNEPFYTPQNNVNIDNEPNIEPNTNIGTYDTSSDSIDFPSLPQSSILATNFLSAYNVTDVQLNEIATKLWSNDFISSITKTLDNVFDSIVGLGVVMFEPLNIEVNKNIQLGNMDTGVVSNKINQFTVFNFGELNLLEFYASELDYNNTTISIFLPCIGVRKLNTSEVQNSVLNLKYHIDVLSGDILAMLKVTKLNSEKLNSVMYTFNGNCKMNLPISQRNNNNMGSMLGLIGSSISGNFVSAFSSALNFYNTPTDNITTRGNLQGSLSIMGIRQAYLIIERGQQAKPQNMENILGYASNITSSISSLDGYFNVQNFVCSIENITDEEYNELKTVMESGVYM